MIKKKPMPPPLIYKFPVIFFGLYSRSVFIAIYHGVYQGPDFTIITKTLFFAFNSNFPVAKQILNKSRSAFSEKWICAFSHKQPIQTKTPTHSPVLLGCSNPNFCAVESINRRYYVKPPPPQFAENLG